MNTKHYLLTFLLIICTGSMIIWAATPSFVNRDVDAWEREQARIKAKENQEQKQQEFKSRQAERKAKNLDKKATAAINEKAKKQARLSSRVRIEALEQQVETLQKLIKELNGRVARLEFSAFSDLKLKKNEKFGRTKLEVQNQGR